MLKQVYPRERIIPVLIAQEAVLGVFKEETLLPLPGCDPPYYPVRSL
jgi:hypothetical protein